MYEDILVTTDGSKESMTVVEHASALAHAFDADVKILYVVDVRSSPLDMSELVVEAFEEAGKESTRKIQKEFEEYGVDSETFIEYGFPAQTILSFAEDKSVDVIIMSTHGRTGVDRFLLGSVAEKVIRKSKLPVLTVGRRN